MATPQTALNSGETEEANQNSGLNPGETEEANPSASGLNPGETEEANPNEGASSGAPQSLTSMLLDQGRQIATSVGSAATDLGTGLVKGMADSVSTGENALSHVLPENAGGSFMRNQSQMEDQFADTHGNTAQQVGKGVENLGEFFLGDEALKGLSFAEKAGVLKQIADLAEKHPAIAALIKRGLRTGAVTGAQTLIKGGTPTQAAEGAGIGAVGGAAVDAGLQGLSKVSDIAKDAFTTRQIQPAVKSAIDKFLSAIEKAGNFIEPEAEESGELGGVAEKPTPATSYRAKAQELGQKFIDRGNSMLSKLDEATGKHWQSYAQNLQDAERALNEHLSDASSESNVTQEHKLVRDVAIAKENLATANAQVRAAGISQQMIDQANADIRQGNALKDLQKGMTKASSGINPDSTVGAAEKAKAPELVNAKSIHDHVDKMAHQTSRYGSDSRLVQAAGGDQALADKFTSDTVLNNLKHSAILARQQAAKKLAGWAAWGLGGYGAAKGVTHIWDSTLGKAVPVQ